jgi:hypothetical protein
MVAGGKPLNLADIHRPDLFAFMKLPNQLLRFSSLFSIALITGILPCFQSQVTGAESDAATFSPLIAQQLFASPEAAINALRVATEANDESALQRIFGPEVREQLTGDAVLDANHAKRFAAAMAQSCKPVKESDDKITLEVGTNNWPMPIPLVQAGGKWHFDTAAGKAEVINRHIGKDELHAIGVCRAYVTAQRQYADAIPKVGGGATYAQKFKSTPGKKDGLYWPAAQNEPASPFGPLVAEAHAEGYGNTKGTGPKPFHGYYFRILTQQGAAAPGGKIDYMSEGQLVAGFAFVAYPELWDQSGIMTFIVNQDGKVFQSNLGAQTARIAGEMKEYNPGTEWTLVQAEGLLNVVSEK